MSTETLLTPEEQADTAVAMPFPPSTHDSASTTSWRPFKNGITSLTIDIPQPRSRAPLPPTGDVPRRRKEVQPQPSRWRSKEFCAYYAVFVVIVPYMAKVVVDLSREDHPNYHHFSHRLRKGWIFGWQVDMSDHQWNVFRNNIPILASLVGLWYLSSALYNRLVLRPSTLPTPAQRINFILLFSVPLLTFLHGTSFPKMLVILWLNYHISKMASWGGNWTRAAPLVGWAFNLAVLFGNEICEGYRWGNLTAELGFLDADWVKGFLPRWHVNWNITMLRLVSFNMDYYWACTTPPLDAETKANPTKEIDERSRAQSSHPLPDYNFKSYLSYALYPPLYLAGPIITYNSFLSQLASPPTISRAQIIAYTGRFVTCLLTMELVLHSMYVVAIKDSSREGAWMGSTPFELSMIGFWNLIVVWLKLLIPWRFFRLWALLDGMDPPENMVRCMANNYSTMGFWRAWHRSYNLWVVRYLYIPLGGSSKIWTTLVVFSFVALWHDLSLKLLTWGWVISLFVLPEMAAKKFVPYSIHGGTWWYRHLAALGGVANILMMMTANLIGFAIGTEGMAYMWSQMVGSWEGVKFMVIASACLFVAVQIMFEYREEEARRGVLRRC